MKLFVAALPFSKKHCSLYCYITIFFGGISILCQVLILKCFQVTSQLLKLMSCSVASCIGSRQRPPLVSSRFTYFFYVRSQKTKIIHAFTTFTSGMPFQWIQLPRAEITRSGPKWRLDTMTKNALRSRTVKAKPRH